MPTGQDSSIVADKNLFPSLQKARTGTLQVELATALLLVANQL